MPNVVTPLKVLSLKKVTSWSVITCGVPGVRIGPALASEWIRPPIALRQAGEQQLLAELAARALAVLAGKRPDPCHARQPSARSA